MQLVNGGARTQARLSFSYVRKVLEAVIGGLTLASVLHAHCYATRREDIPVIRAVWESMLRESEEEKVSAASLSLMFVQNRLSTYWLFSRRCERNIDHNLVLNCPSR